MAWSAKSWKHNSTPSNTSTYEALAPTGTGKLKGAKIGVVAVLATNPTFNANLARPAGGGPWSLFRPTVRLRRRIFTVALLNATYELQIQDTDAVSNSYWGQLDLS